MTWDTQSPPHSLEARTILWNFINWGSYNLNIVKIWNFVRLYLTICPEVPIDLLNKNGCRWAIKFQQSILASVNGWSSWNWKVSFIMAYRMFTKVVLKVILQTFVNRLHSDCVVYMTRFLNISCCDSAWTPMIVASGNITIHVLV